MPRDAYAILRRTAAEFGVPTVLEADDDALTRGLAGGPSKAFTDAVRNRLAADQTVVDTRHYLGAERDAVAHEVARLLGVLGVAGTAT
jgi:fructose-bisphosphate aldolase class II